MKSWADPIVARIVGVIVVHVAVVTIHVPNVISVRRARRITTYRKTRGLIIVIPYTIYII